MRDILFFTLDDLGAGRSYTIAIICIVLFAIACVLIRDAFLWFEGLSVAALEDPADMAEAAGNGGDGVDASRPPVFISAQHPSFGRRHPEAS